MDRSTRSDYFPGQPWTTADSLLGPDVYEREWSSMDWTRAENFLRMTGAAYVKHHFDGRGNISHSICIRKDQWKAPGAFKLSSVNLIGFFTLFNGGPSLAASFRMKR